MSIYRDFFKKYALFLVLLTIVGASSGLAITKLLPKSYDVSLAVDIERKAAPTDKFYTYDGYYAIQATELFAKSVTSWFITPSFVEDVLKNADKADLDQLSVKDFRRVFTPEQISANLVEVRFGVKDSALGLTLTEAINSSIKSYIESRDIQDYTIRVGDPVIRQKEYNPIFFSLGGLVLAFALGISIAAIKEYYWKK
jgi:hypothetical protein